MMFELQAVQDALAAFQIDGWLLYDFRGSNVPAQRVLRLAPDAGFSRRWFYFIPQKGTPQKLVHRIEAGSLDHLPGEKHVYLRWQELEAGVKKLVQGCETLAMEYSPRNANPYVSKVDGGTLELVRSCGVGEVVSSGDLIQQFEAVWTDQQWEQHQRAAEQTHAAFHRAWRFIADGVRNGGSVEEKDVSEVIMQHFTATGMTTYHPPIVAVGPNAGNPHYETGTGNRTGIHEGDLVLIDLWAKLKEPGAVYSDLTRMGFVGTKVPEEYAKVFAIVAAARDAAIAFVRNAFAQGRPIRGCDVDDACRQVIMQTEFQDAFVHRTGHSIGQETHGNGANMDNLETRDQRRVLPRTCFSIEPGIYLPEFGIRSEVNVYVDAQGEVHVTGGEVQSEILPIWRDFP